MVDDFVSGMARGIRTGLRDLIIVTLALYLITGGRRAFLDRAIDWIESAMSGIMQMDLDTDISKSRPYNGKMVTGEGDFVTNETEYGQMISQAALRHGIDPMLFTAQIKQESLFDPNAVSHAGAKGLGQLMPIIQNWCGLADPFDPYGNLDCSATFMADLLSKYDSVTLALAAYNAGEPAVNNCGFCVPVGEPTKYVKAINNYWNEYKQQQTVTAVPAGKLTITTAVNLLYASSEPWMTQGWHPSAGLPDAQDWKAGCGSTLFSPVPGAAKITYNGDDGLGVGNTMITVEGAGGKVTLLHGDYVVSYGDVVIGGQSVIGREASNGNSSGCHSHVIVYP